MVLEIVADAAGWHVTQLAAVLANAVDVERFVALYVAVLYLFVDDGSFVGEFVAADANGVVDRVAE